MEFWSSRLPPSLSFFSLGHRCVLSLVSPSLVIFLGLAFLYFVSVSLEKKFCNFVQLLLAKGFISKPLGSGPAHRPTCPLHPCFPRHTRTLICQASAASDLSQLPALSHLPGALPTQGSLSTTQFDLCFGHSVDILPSWRL